MATTRQQLLSDFEEIKDTISWSEYYGSLSGAEKLLVQDKKPSGVEAMPRIGDSFSTIHKYETTPNPMTAPNNPTTTKKKYTWLWITGGVIGAGIITTIIVLIVKKGKKSV